MVVADLALTPISTPFPLHDPSGVLVVLTTNTAVSATGTRDDGVASEACSDEALPPAPAGATTRSAPPRSCGARLARTRRPTASTSLLPRTTAVNDVIGPALRDDRRHCHAVQHRLHARLVRERELEAEGQHVALRRGGQPQDDGAAQLKVPPLRAPVVAAVHEVHGERAARPGGPGPGVGLGDVVVRQQGLEGADLPGAEAALEAAVLDHDGGLGRGAGRRARGGGGGTRVTWNSGGTAWASWAT
ncbi:hypothetical protein PG997_009199 [Apiospora hydei]|uniref:Uncharacterized protein n=1 Tax=Apiospora hydei TaxID=1337664 RepID=A0ABR1VTE1_9PEZI